MQFLAGFLLAAACQFSTRMDPQESGNVLLIVADDLGVDQLADYGVAWDHPNTPVLHSLAREGVLFRNAWAYPACSPTRACIQTGRYGFRTGVGYNVYPGTDNLPLSEDEWTLPEMLDWGTGGAYAHAAIGKWHLGNDYVGEVLAPNRAGYSHFAGALRNLPRQANGYERWDRTENGVQRRVHRYATSTNVDDALGWIRGRSGPWFCYLAFHAPHYPYHRPPDALHTVDFSQEDTDRMRYKAMVEAMDSEIGRLLAGLPDRRRTTVIFMGDNGTPREVLAAGVPARHSKWHLFQGGVRVPLLFSGHAVGAPGTACEALVTATDLFATVAELAGVALADRTPAGARLDSISLVPWLRAPGLPGARKAAYAEIFEQNGTGHFSSFDYLAGAITDGQYKLVLSHHYFRHEPMAFYDLLADPWESHDLLEGPLSAEAHERLGRLRSWIKLLRR